MAAAESKVTSRTGRTTPITRRVSLPGAAPASQALSGAPSGEVSMSEKQHRLVVGVDGSPSSRAALRWAVRHAELTKGIVTAIAAWDYPVFYGMEIEGVFDDVQHAAEQALASTVAEIVRDRAGVEVRQEVAHGNPTQVLLDAARDADLLVVGSRGHGGFAAALLGSVSQHCAQHSACPVVIVREQDR
jgi:nucleotide-binding universal stress UspA family protein